jgi:hypothetical protein
MGAGAHLTFLSHHIIVAAGWRLLNTWNRRGRGERREKQAQRRKPHIFWACFTAKSEL